MNPEQFPNGGVATAVEGQVASITFYHPMSNSLPGVVLQSLAEAIEEMGKNEAVRVIVLKSFGNKAFCGGASFDELIAISDSFTGKVFFSGFARVINAMRKCPKLIIGRVQGRAVGGGVGLASAVDYCFATTRAQVKLSELAVGIGPFVVGPAVERKMGLSAMSELAINATEWREASWAKEKGLYNELYETEEAMDQAIDSLAQRLANSNPEAMKELKGIFWRGTEDWDELLAERAGISGRLVLSDFTKESIQKFKSK